MAFPDPEILTLSVVPAVPMNEMPKAPIGNPTVEVITSFSGSLPVASLTLSFVDMPRMSGSGGGSGGSCEDDRPETGMLYPRG